MEHRHLIEFLGRTWTVKTDYTLQEKGAQAKIL
jgi:hypothetical protein